MNNYPSSYEPGERIYLNADSCDHVAVRVGQMRHLHTLITRVANHRDPDAARDLQNYFMLVVEQSSPV